MPFAGFEDFDSCLIEMQDEGYSEDEAQRICGSLQEEYEERGEEEAQRVKERILEDAEAVIDELDLGLFSFVENPAQPSEFIMMKSEDKNFNFKTSTPILKAKKDDWEIVYGAVMIPGVVDEQGDLITQSAIRESAHEFQREGNIDSIDVNHDMIAGKGEMLETWLLKEDKEFKLPDGGSKEYPQGTWMVGVQPDDNLKQEIEDGNITGFSIYGESNKIKLSKRDKEEEMNENNISSKNNNKDDKMDEEQFKELKEMITTGFNELKDQLENEDDEKDDDKQEIEEMGDALDWLSENAPEEVESMIIDAVRSNEEAEDEDEDEDEDEEEQESSEDEQESNEEDTEEGKSTNFKQNDSTISDEDVDSNADSFNEIAKKVADEKLEGDV